MRFTIKDDFSKSKCSGCVHAFVAETFHQEQPTVLCKLLGVQVKPIRSCNHFTSHIYAPIPVHMAMTALEIDPDRVRARPGFRVAEPLIEHERPSIEDKKDDERRG